MECPTNPKAQHLTTLLTPTPKELTMEPTTKPTEPKARTTAEGVETSSQSSRSVLEKNAILPSEEIITINAMGTLINQPCSHRKIPGLDADFCSTCRIWWVDQQMRDLLLGAKKQ